MRLLQLLIYLCFMTVSPMAFCQEKQLPGSSYLDQLHLKAYVEVRHQSYKEAISSIDTLIAKAQLRENPQMEFKGYDLLGQVYTALKDTTKTREVYERGLQIAQQCNNDTLIAQSYRNIGSVYLQSSIYLDKAIALYQKSLKINARLKNDAEYLNSNLNISSAYLKSGNIEEAYPYLIKAKHFSLKDTLNVVSRAKLLTLSGKYYTITNKKNLAEDNLINAISIAFSNGLLVEEEEAQKQLAELYEKYEDYQAAFFHTKRQLQLANEVYKNKSQREIQLATAHFDLREGERDLAAAKKEQELTEKAVIASKNSATAYLITAIGLFIALLFIFFLYKSRKRFIRRLSENNKQLTKAKDEAEQLSKLKTQFFSTISHELRTPLYGVIGIASILLEDKRIKTHRDDLKSLKFSADYLLALINDVLLMSKMEAKHIKLESTPYRLSTLMNSITRSFEFSLEQNNNKLHLEIDSSLPDKLVGDSVRLSQILMNLIGNAIKFNENGNIWVSILKTGMSKEGVYQASFIIKDDGIGIPFESQESIFEEFSQVENRNYNYQGTGLGLPIVKKLLDLYDSEIQLTSAPEEGASFSFTINLESAQDDVVITQKIEQAETSETIQAAHTLQKMHILVVDDNRINQKITQRILEGKGFICSLANDGIEAVELVSTKTYDLILMDIHMPNKDGLQATKEIREFDTTTPIIALTAVEIAEIRHKVQEAGMDDILVKPYDVSQFLNVILRNIEQKKKSKFRSVK